MNGFVFSFSTRSTCDARHVRAPGAPCLPGHDGASRSCVCARWRSPAAYTAIKSTWSLSSSTDTLRGCTSQPTNATCALAAWQGASQVLERQRPGVPRGRRVGGKQAAGCAPPALCPAPSPTQPNPALWRCCSYTFAGAFSALPSACTTITAWSRRTHAQSSRCVGAPPRAAWRRRGSCARRRSGPACAAGGVLPRASRQRGS